MNFFPENVYPHKPIQKARLGPAYSLYFFLITLCAILFTSCTQYKDVQISQIGGVKIIKITDKGIEMELGMKINNPNTYGFSIFRSSFDIKLGGVDMGTATLSKKEKVAANSDEMHTFHITTTFSKLLEGGLGSI